MNRAFNQRSALDATRAVRRKVEVSAKTMLALTASALLVGCAHAPTREFVQGSVRITPPIKMDQSDFAIIEDGGTAPGRFTDAKGQVFDFCIDRRIDTNTPGAIYLLAYPGERNSIRVKDEAGFRRKLELPETEVTAPSRTASGDGLPRIQP